MEGLFKGAIGCCLIVLFLGISYLITAGLLYGSFVLAELAGITMPIEWSWALSGFVWLMLTLFKSSIEVVTKS
jgi:hypothetical protein